MLHIFQKNTLVVIIMTWFFLKFKDQSCHAKNRSSGEMDNILFETYKNNLMPHENNMFQTASDMAM